MTTQKISAIQKKGRNFNEWKEIKHDGTMKAQQCGFEDGSGSLAHHPISCTQSSVSLPASTQKISMSTRPAVCYSVANLCTKLIMNQASYTEDRYQQTCAGEDTALF